MVVLLPAPLGPRKPKMLPPLYLEGNAVNGPYRTGVVLGKVLNNNSLIDHERHPLAWMQRQPANTSPTEIWPQVGPSWTSVPVALSSAGMTVPVHEPAQLLRSYPIKSDSSSLIAKDALLVILIVLLDILAHGYPEHGVRKDDVGEYCWVPRAEPEPGYEQQRSTPSVPDVPGQDSTPSATAATLQTTNAKGVDDQHAAIDHRFAPATVKPVMRSANRAPPMP